MSEIYKLWIYHKEKEPIIITSDQKDKYLEDGWADSPAAFFDMKKHGFDPKDEVQVQEIGLALEGVKEMANQAINLDSMIKPELLLFAEEHLGVDLDARFSEDNLRTQIKELLEKDSIGIEEGSTGI